MNHAAADLLSAPGPAVCLCCATVLRLWPALRLPLALASHRHYPPRRDADTSHPRCFDARSVAQSHAFALSPWFLNSGEDAAVLSCDAVVLFCSAPLRLRCRTSTTPHRTTFPTSVRPSHHPRRCHRHRATVAQWSETKGEAGQSVETLNMYIFVNEQRKSLKVASLVLL